MKVYCVLGTVPGCGVLRTSMGRSCFELSG